MFLSSFFAILMAGLIIAVYNHRYLKHERWCKTADEFCANLEKITIDYFDNQHDADKEKALNEKFYAYLDAFMLFIAEKSKPEIDALCRMLLDLDNDEDINAEERMRQALRVLATVRHDIIQ